MSFIGDRIMMLVKIIFKTPLHIGEAGIGLEETSQFIHSDTLYSAIFQAWLRLFGETMSDVVLTSAFPFVGNIYYFPRPLLPIPDFTSDLALQYGKAIKRIRFVDYDNFKKWITGMPLDLEEVLNTSDIISKAIISAVQPKVSLDRMTLASNLYYVGETVFANSLGAGLFFLVKLKAEQMPKFKAALKFLGEEGIGGRRSQGYGAFEAEFEDSFYLDEPETPNAYVTLSLFHPASDGEIRDNLYSYRLVERTGWLEGEKANFGMRHKRVLMIAEGSVFHRRVSGTVVDVAPSGFDAHPVYRNGLAFIIGARLEAK